MSDSEICTRIKQSDHLAYTEIYHRYFDPIFRHAFKKLRDEDAAKDIVQDVFTNLWLKRSAYNIESNPAGYLYTSVRNGIFNFWAKKEIRSSYWDSCADDHYIDRYTNASTDYKIREQQLAAYIERQLMGFSPRMREIFKLSRKDHLSHREIAEQLNTTEANVSKQVGNALKILRAKIGTMIFLFLIVLTCFILIGSCLSHCSLSLPGC
ncbi:RNA polymerase sigma-70 factor [Mucilaginibacter sabulilitoris]|uniref:RNA polymerase sigma-70 factor n=1 Tax=Mucilaginibacter sabulilitoris TaxID=1173583 RepID=A0ABZ0TWC4_9SPHI|nr:RNA polymerase sigma-70 factor [Mucilaginibacter sabulilitoris]WPU95750.1 RNA polymerase sigma-70 factor [Mucilaginibacter sabulilitoris]